MCITSRLSNVSIQNVTVDGEVNRQNAKRHEDRADSTPSRYYQFLREIASDFYCDVLMLRPRYDILSLNIIAVYKKRARIIFPARFRMLCLNYLSFKIRLAVALQRFRAAISPECSIR